MNTLHRFALLSLCISGWLTSGVVHAKAEPPWYLSSESVTAVYGSGNNVIITGLGVRSKEWIRYDSGSWNAHVLLAGQVALWNGQESAARTSQIVDMSITPILRVAHLGFKSFTPYVELGIGAHLISHTQINRDRKFSTAFQFGEHVEVGMQFGARREYGLGLSLQHVSNGSIKGPNNGLTYVGLNFLYTFP